MALAHNMQKDEIKTVEAPIVNIHGSLDETPEDGITEKQQLVISTKTMNLQNWKKTRIYASVSEFLFFNKLLQIPFLYLCYEKNISFKELFEKFIKNDHDFKEIKSINKNLKKHANDISKGKSEFIFKEGYLDIYWPPGEFEYINLIMKNKLDLFYDEAKKLYSDYTENDKVSQEILNECFLLNRKLMRIHGEYEDVKLGLNYNLVDFYNSVLELEKIEIKKQPQNIQIIKSDLVFKSYSDWMREVIWYGHRTGKYLCDIKNLYEKNEVDKNHSNLIGPYIA